MPTPAPGFPTAARAALCLALLLAGCAAGGTEASFARWDADLRAAGKLRADRDPIDAPYGREDLIRNFAKVGFGSEFEIVDGDYTPLDLDRDAPLTRWEEPIRYAVLGNPTEKDAAEVEAFADRLSAITGLRIGEAEDSANLMIFLLDERGRREVGRLFRASDEYGPLADLFDAWAGDPAWPCAAEFYFTPPDRDGAYAIYFAIVYIRAEVSGISRRSCIEEEIAQTMGLARDDPSLRPSVFNDDEEFALMTEHDADLLRVLYDPRLEPGMRADEAMPIVRRIVEDLDPAR